MTRFFLLTSTFFLFFQFCSGQAGDRRTPPSPAELLERMDTNNDSRLSPKEVRGPLSKHFAEFDTNEDGFLSQQELENIPPPQQRGRRQLRVPEAKDEGFQNRDLKNVSSSFKNETNISLKGNRRIITSNGIPSHKVGDFPNPNNPNTIREQRHRFSIDTNPIIEKEIKPLITSSGMFDAYKFGIALNGIPFDPIAAEFWVNPQNQKMNVEWNYEALGVNLGNDGNNAHVQPNGAYHYHGVPKEYIKNLSSDKHSPIIGYAADGFPIYYQYIFDEQKQIIRAKSSYRLKKGERNGDGFSAPNGQYDGTFTADYEFVEGLGHLDTCNGTYGPTPDYPKGIYYYVITDDYPQIPRCFVGKPSKDFKVGR